jgi:hypothetical protein
VNFYGTVKFLTHKVSSDVDEYKRLLCINNTSFRNEDAFYGVSECRLILQRNGIIKTLQ